MSGACGFTLSHYRYCLELAKDLGYEFLTLSDYVSRKDRRKTLHGKIITLRHDIDFDLKLAPNFADLEHTLGIRSTWFVRIHGKYSITDLDHYRILSKLSAQGHELGLHHDCDFAALVNENAREFFRRDKTIFESVINRKISGVSSHEPNKSKFLISDRDIAKFGLQYQAYSDVFLKEMKYISDSSSRWREGCMCGHIKKEVPKLCILTHPIWWFNQSPLENY